MREMNPNCERLFYVVCYVWKNTGARKFASIFSELSDAMQFMKMHIDDNVNIEWTIVKMSKIDLIDFIKDIC